MTALIAGGGIAGLTLALALARRGATALLVERAPRLEETGAGVQLSPNAGRAIEALGLADALDAVAVRPEAVSIVDAPSGRQIKRLTLGAAAERRWGAPYRVVHRADLQALLLRAVRANGRVEIRLGAELRDARETAAGVEIDIFGEDGRSPVEGDWLAGCDGLHSVARLAVGAPETVTKSGLKAWRVTLPAAEIPPEFFLRNVSVWLGPAAHMVVYPLRLGREANVVLIGGEHAESPASLVAGWASPARRLVTGTRDWSPWPLHDRPPDARMQRGRIALLGDAAHAALPSLAQGAAFAIEDAVVLARLVSSGGPQALPAYQAARAGRVARMQTGARRQIGIDHLSGIAASVRNAALSAAPEGALLRGLDWIYGWRDED